MAQKWTVYKLAQCSEDTFQIYLVISTKLNRLLYIFIVDTDLFLSYCVADAPADDRNVIHPAQVYKDLKNNGYTWWGNFFWLKLLMNVYIKHNNTVET